MTPFEKSQQAEKVDKIRRDKIADIARNQNLVIVQMTPRRCIVVRITSCGGVGADFRNKETRYFTRTSGEVAFGPASYPDCVAWHNDQVEPLPDELMS